METIKDTANGEVRSKKVWTGIGLAILVLVVGGLAFAAYKNPQLFRASTISGIGGVGSMSGVTGGMGGYTTPQTGSIELNTNLTPSKDILDQSEIGLPLTTDAKQNLEGGGLPLLPKVTPVLPPEIGVIPGSELRKEVLKDKVFVTSNTLTVNATPIAPSCGNGTPESGEFCDDGNATVDGTCNAGCTAFTKCGDGTRQQPNGLGVTEVCDDGNDTNQGDCNATCLGFTYCGDGEVQNPNGMRRAEACDTAGASATCTATCTVVAACTVASCFTDAEAAKVDDYLLGQYTPTPEELVKFDTNCPRNGITDGDSAYISDHICP